MARRARVETALGKLPLYFIENHGQLDARVGYYVQGRDKIVYFTPQGLTFALSATERRLTAIGQPAHKDSVRPASLMTEADHAAQTQRWVLSSTSLVPTLASSPSARTRLLR